MYTNVMERTTTDRRSTHRTTDAAIQAYISAELAAEGRPAGQPARLDLAAIDNAAQAALENSDATGRAFADAHAEIFSTAHYLVTDTDQSPAEMAATLRRLRLELAHRTEGDR